MKRILNHLLFTLTVLTTTTLLSGCQDEVLYQEGVPFDGDVTLQLDFEFEGMGAQLDSRAVNGSLDWGINRLTLFLYKYADDENLAPAYVFDYNDKSEFDVYEVLEARKDADGNDHHCEEKTYHGKVTIYDIKGDEYRIYAAANVDVADKTGKSLSEVTEKELREIQIAWPENASGEGGVTSATSFGVPDAMFGYFTNDGLKDHDVKKYRNVIHHNTDLYTKSTDSNDAPKAANANRAPKVTLDKEHMQMQAWLKRVVSKLTIGFDGSQLNDGIEIYIKSVTIKDAADKCFLGHDNSAGSKNDVQGKSVDLLNNDDYADDERFNLVYETEPGAAGVVLNNKTSVFPRRNDNDKIENPEWKEFIHGSIENPNPLYNLRPTTLYFFENLQGVEDGEPKKESHKDSSDQFIKDTPDGTYVEVQAYYRNTNAGEKNSGNITYRFMLGKNITNDYNTERNFHYKLVLSFIGNANNPDWHIEYEGESSIYFPIPSGSQWDVSNVWHAFNDQGEPIAEIARELVYWNPNTDNDINLDQDLTARKRDGLIYYQIVSVYPVKKIDDKYLVDMTSGMVAQVKKCATKPKLDDSDLKAGGELYMYLRTQMNMDLVNKDKVHLANNGYYAIKKLTNGGHEDYDYVEVLSTDFDLPVIGKQTMTKLGGENKWSFVESNEETGKKCNLKLGDMQRDKLRIEPYRIQDADGNYYGVTKIGASYWAQEDLKTTHYFEISSDGFSTAGAGQPVYPWKPNLKDQKYEHDTDGKYHPTTETIKGTNDPSNSYDYDFGVDEFGDDYVMLYERYPMYKECNNVKLYNFFTALGVRGQLDKKTNTEVFKVGSMPAQSAGYDYIDPNWEPWGTYSIACQRLGQFDVPGIDDGPITYDTENLPILSFWYLGEFYNKVLAPEGWHALPMEDSLRPGYWGEQLGDHDYLETFSNFNWEHYLYPNSFGNWQWPSVPGSDIVNRDISNLSLLPIPADWETNKNFVTFDADLLTGLYQGSLHGVCMGFWGNTISDEFYENPKENPGKQLLYACPGFINFDTKQNWLARTIFSQDFTYQYESTKSYLPIRMVRNAYDYTVQPIGAVQ